MRLKTLLEDKTPIKFLWKKELERISALKINPEPIIDLELESKNRGRYPKLQEYNYDYNLNGF